MKKGPARAGARPRGQKGRAGLGGDKARQTSNALDAGLFPSIKTAAKSTTPRRIVISPSCAHYRLRAPPRIVDRSGRAPSGPLTVSLKTL